MKSMKKILAFALVLVMLTALGATAFASDTEPAPSAAPATDGKITVTPPTGTTADSKNTYTLYKVFDATSSGSNYSYSLTGDHTTVPAGFILDDAGNVFFADVVTAEGEGTFKVKVGGQEKILKNKTSLSENDIKAIADYVEGDSPVDTIEVTGTNPAVFSGLTYGYYYVATTTGTLVVIDSTQPDVEVTDKNKVPSLDKKITGANSIDDAGKKAIAQVGTNVEYTLTVTKQTGAENYVVYDNLGTGLKYNKDVVVKIGTDVVADTNYTKTETDSSLVVAFKNDYISTVVDGTEITLTYTALVTEDALQTEPAKNTAHLEYGHNPGDNKTPVVETETYNAKFSVIKQDGKGAALAGAGFVLKNSENKYYKYTAATQATEADTEAGTEATAAAPEKVEWVDSIDDATEYTSNGTDGKLNGEFTGLANGTYTLVEKTVPDGYNAAADFEFTVEGKNFTAENLIQETTVINNQGAELPSTGGIGTTLFYVFGTILVLGAGVVLVTKRRVKE